MEFSDPRFIGAVALVAGIIPAWALAVYSRKFALSRIAENRGFNFAALPSGVFEPLAKDMIFAGAIRNIIWRKEKRVTGVVYQIKTGGYRIWRPGVKEVLPNLEAVLYSPDFNLPGFRIMPVDLHRDASAGKAVNAGSADDKTNDSAVDFGEFPEFSAHYAVTGSARAKEFLPRELIAILSQVPGYTVRANGTYIRISIVRTIFYPGQLYERSVIDLVDMLQVIFAHTKDPSSKWYARSW